MITWLSNLIIENAGLLIGAAIVLGLMIGLFSFFKNLFH